MKISVKKNGWTQKIKLETEENSREGNNGRTEKRDGSIDTLASDTRQKIGTRRQSDRRQR